MDAQSLKKLMDPKNIDMTARYENARSAVAIAYNQARHLSYVGSVLSGGEHVEATVEEQAASYLKVARILIPQIEQDLNECLKRLEDRDDGNSTATA